MTENKRFMLDDAGELIDLNTHSFIEYGDEVCNLLNELAEENIELHIHNDFLKDENQHMRDLVNENEQLKQLLDYADDLIQSYMSVHNRDEWENVKKNITGDVE